MITEKLMRKISGIWDAVYTKTVHAVLAAMFEMN